MREGGSSLNDSHILGKLTQEVAIDWLVVGVWPDRYPLPYSPHPRQTC